MGKSNNNKNQSALDRLIHQVHTILPHLGKGYIETALACYNHNIEETTNALMEGEVNPSSLHPRLRVLDKALPARRKERKEQYEVFASSASNSNGEIDVEEEVPEEPLAETIEDMVVEEPEVPEGPQINKCSGKSSSSSILSKYNYLSPI